MRNPAKQHYCLQLLAQLLAELSYRLHINMHITVNKKANNLNPDTLPHAPMHGRTAFLQQQQ
jgi:hypothetical protein